MVSLFCLVGWGKDSSSTSTCPLMRLVWWALKAFDRRLISKLGLIKNLLSGLGFCSRLGIFGHVYEFILYTVSSWKTQLLQWMKSLKCSGVLVGNWGTLSIMMEFMRVCSGVAARETAQALRTLAQAARGVAACNAERQSAAAMLDSASHVMEGSTMLIHEAQQALVCPGDAESQQRLAQVKYHTQSSLLQPWCLFVCFYLSISAIMSCLLWNSENFRLIQVKWGRERFWGFFVFFEEMSCIPLPPFDSHFWLVLFLGYTLSLLSSICKVAHCPISVQLCPVNQVVVY